MEPAGCWQPRSDHDRLRDVERASSTHGALLVIALTVLAWLTWTLAARGLLKLPAGG